METPWPADSSPNFNDYIPLDVQWMTKNKDISTNHGVQGGLQVFCFFFFLEKQRHYEDRISLVQAFPPQNFPMLLNLPEIFMPVHPQ